MNKQEFITKLSEDTGCTIEDCEKVNEILENNFIFSKKNHDVITKAISASLSVGAKQADMIYESAKNIINNSVKDSLRHPFHSKD